jgi:hypothetical protein
MKNLRLLMKPVLLVIPFLFGTAARCGGGDDQVNQDGSTESKSDSSVPTPSETNEDNSEGYSQP